ncbi:MAG: ComEC/Rec2 family competence protein [Lacipirellulaceae bacterium]
MHGPTPTPPSRRYNPLLAVAAAFLTGILVDRSIATVTLAMWVALCVLALFLAWRFRRQQAFQRAASFTLIATLCLGGGWANLRWNYFPVNDLGRYAGEQAYPLCCEALISDPVTLRPLPAHNPLRALPASPRSETTISVRRLRNGETWQEVRGECRLRINGEATELSPGQRVRIFGRFERTSPAMNPGSIDWAARDRGRGRLANLYCNQVECVTSTVPSPQDSIVERLRIASEQNLKQHISQDQAPLAAALLLGAREQLSDDEVEAFFQTGVIHLLVVSGLHVGMAAALLLLLARIIRVPWNLALLLTAVAVLTYALVTGMRPPVIRACLMTSLGLAALYVGRPVAVLNLLAAAAIAIGVYNPSEVFNPGTLLSFLSVAALCGLGNWSRLRQTYDPLDELILTTRPWHQRLGTWFGKKGLMLTIASLVAWTTTAPIVARVFHLSTPGTVLVTPLLWPLIAAALMSGLLVIGFGWVPPVGWLLGKFCTFCLSAIQEIVSTAHSLEFGSFYCVGPQTWWLVGLYVGLAIVAWRGLHTIPWRWTAAGLVVWSAFGLFVAGLQRSNDEELHCTFLAMGHGTCAVLELPDGKTLLYDAGSLNSPESASQTIANFLWSRGIIRIDGIVLSHADVDHYNAVPGLLKRFPIGTVYVSPLMFDPLATGGQLNAPEYLREVLAEENIPLREVWMNDRLAVQDEHINIEVLHPPRTGVVGRDNANSITLLIEFGGKRILLPGDLEHAGIEAVMLDAPENVDLLLAPHHGSAGSDPPGFAAWCTPDHVVVSGRNRSRTTLANRSYRAVGAEVLHTSDRGALQFTLTSDDLEVKSFR